MRGELTPDQCIAVKKYVIDMFEECEIHTLPIDPFEIAKKLYYVLRPYSSLTPEQLDEAWAISGDAFSRVERNPKTGMLEYVIYYNNWQIPNRIRWSLFHEIGHCYMGHHDHPDNSLLAIEEAEANLFAKYAIAPPPLIHVLGLQSGNDVARAFHTSGIAGEHCFDYYRKWLRKGPKDYTDYERHLLSLFHVNVA